MRRAESFVGTLLWSMVVSVMFGAAAHGENKPTHSVAAEIRLASGQTARVTVAEDSFVLLRTDATGEALLLSPSAVDVENGTLTWRLFALSDATGVQRIRRVDEAATFVGLLETLRGSAMSTMTVQVQEITTERANPSSSLAVGTMGRFLLQLFEREGPLLLCCVTCDGETVCGQSVDLWCDQCP